MAHSKLNKYFRIENCFIINMEQKCNNHCIFCMNRAARNDQGAESFDDAFLFIVHLPKQCEIDFFGGEPTIYPEFYSLLRYARKKGHSCALETNGRRFSDKQFSSKVAKLGAKYISIQISLHSHSLRIHDSITGVTGSFDETIKGIQNIVHHDFPLVINVVITKKNVNHLYKIVSFLHGISVQRMKFSMIAFVSNTIVDIVPSIEEVRRGIAKATQVANHVGLDFFIEKTPLCVAPLHRDRYLLYERRIGNNMRVFVRECRGCVLRNECEGIDKGYLKYLGAKGIQKIKG